MIILRSESDFFTSVYKALEEIDPDFEKYTGLLCVGSHFPAQIQEKIENIRRAREENVPFLGICFGMQLAAIEYARNVLGIVDATSEELAEGGTHVIKKMPELRVGVRLVCWDGSCRMESHWHNYNFNKDFERFYKDNWEMAFMDGVLEVMKLKNHPFFVGIQFHPEYQSSRKMPHPLLKEFIKACRKSAL